MNTQRLTHILRSLFIFLMSFSSVSAQLKINSSGNVELEGASNTICTLDGSPITFKVNNILTGFTGTPSNSNSSFGFGALSNSLVGSDNTAIGIYALKTNTTTIGYNAQATGNNQVVISDGSIVKATISVNWTITSDGRTKKNIQTNVPDLRLLRICSL